MSDKPKITKPMCPGCGEVPADDRQEARPNLCRWCGHNHDTGQPAGFVSASDPFAALDADFADPSPTEREVSSERVSEEAVWRNLALQFDGHRIDALSMLRFAVRCIEEYATVRDILKLPLSELKAFLSKPPLSGDEVLKQRIEFLALHSSVKTVGVKKLEWRVLTEGFSLQRAETTLGDYRIWREVSGAWFWSLYDGKYSGGSEDKEDQAKAAAQADYERRILSAIEAPSEGSAVAWLSRCISGPYKGELEVEFIKPDSKPSSSWSEWFPVYTHPSPAASIEVTEEMVELAARAYDEFAFESWQRSYDYEMGQSGNADEAKSFADWSMGKRIDEVRANSRAALTAALKGDRP